VEGRKEELPLDPVPPPPGLEDRDRQLVLEGAEVAVHGPDVHVRQARDLGHRHALVPTAPGVQDVDDRQQASQPVSLAG
jgi:hypothetical protein